MNTTIEMREMNEMNEKINFLKTINTKDSEGACKHTEGADSNVDANSKTDADSNANFKTDIKPYFKLEKKYNLIFILFGINALFPWNVFITLDDYWKSQWTQPWFKIHWAAIMAFCSMVANFLGLTINVIYLSDKVSNSIRIKISLSMTILIFFYFLVGIFTNLAHYPFYLSSVLCFTSMFNFLIAICRISTFSLFLQYKKTTKLIVEGQALAGLLVQLLSFIFDLTIPNITTTVYAKIMITLSLAVLTSSLASLIYINKKLHTVKYVDNLRNFRILKKYNSYFILLTLVLTLPLIIFPAIISQYTVKMAINEKFFKYVKFMPYIVGDYVGRIISTRLPKTKTDWIKSSYLYISSFIIFVIILAVKGVTIDKTDSLFIILSFILGSLVGLAVGNIISNITELPEDDVQDAMSFALISIILGLAIGTCLGMILSSLLF